MDVQWKSESGRDRQERRGGAASEASFVDVEIV